MNQPPPPDGRDAPRHRGWEDDDPPLNPDEHTPDQIEGMFVDVPESFTPSEEHEPLHVPEPRQSSVPPASRPHPGPRRQPRQSARAWESVKKWPGRPAGDNRQVVVTALAVHLVLAGLIFLLLLVFPGLLSPLLDRAGVKESSQAPQTWGGDPLNPRVVARLEVMQLEDAAMVRGERTALAELKRQAAERDTADPLRDAAASAVARVETFFSSRIPREQPPRLDAGRILPGATSEDDLGTVALIEVLTDRREQPQNRRRAAYLLREVDSQLVANALVEAQREDPNLFVIAEAFFAFKNITGYPGSDPFDIRSVEAWWSEHAT